MRTTIAVALLLLFASANAELTIEALIEEAGLTTGDVPSRELPGWRVPQKIVVPQTYAAMLKDEFPDIEFVGATGAADAASKVAGADAVLAWCSKDIVDAADRLVWIQIFSSGAERCMAVGQQHATFGNIIHGHASFGAGTEDLDPDQAVRRVDDILGAPGENGVCTGDQPGRVGGVTRADKLDLGKFAPEHCSVRLGHDDFFRNPPAGQFAAGHIASR